MSKAKNSFDKNSKPPGETYEEMLGKLLLTRVQSPRHLIDPAACIGMIEGGAVMTIPGIRQNDAVMLAAGQGLADVVEAAVKMGYRFDEQNKYLETALHTALIGYTEFLIEKGTDRDAVSDFPRTIRAIVNAPCFRNGEVRLDIPAYGKTTAYQMIENLYNKGVHVTVDGSMFNMRTPGIEMAYADITDGLRHQRHLLKSTSTAPATATAPAM